MPTTYEDMAVRCRVEAMGLNRPCVGRGGRSMSASGTRMAECGSREELQKELHVSGEDGPSATLRDGVLVSAGYCSKSGPSLMGSVGPDRKDSKARRFSSSRRPLASARIFVYGCNNGFANRNR